MEKISWTDRVRNEEVLQRAKEEKNVVLTMQGRKTNWIVHILRGGWLLEHAIDGKVEGKREMKRRRGRRSKQLLDELKGKRGYWKLKEEALDRSLCRFYYERCYGIVFRPPCPTYIHYGS